MLAIPPSVPPPAPLPQDVLQFPAVAARPPGAPAIPNSLPSGPAVAPVAPPPDINPAGGLLHMPAVATAQTQLPAEVPSGGPVYSHSASATPPMSPTAAQWDAARRGAHGLSHSGGSQTPRWITPPSAAVQVPPVPGHGAATFSSLEQLAQAAAGGASQPHQNTRLSGDGGAPAPKPEAPPSTPAVHAPYVTPVPGTPAPGTHAPHLVPDPQALQASQPGVAATASFQSAEARQGLSQPGLVSQKLSGIGGTLPMGPVLASAAPPPVVVPPRQEAPASLLVPQRGAVQPVPHMQQIQEGLPFVAAQHGHLQQPFYVVPQPLYPHGALSQQMVHPFQDVQHFEAPVLLHTAAGPLQYTRVPATAMPGVPQPGVLPHAAGPPPLQVPVVGPHVPVAAQQVPLAAQQVPVATQQVLAMGSDVPAAAPQVPGVQLAQYNLSTQAVVSSMYPTFAQGAATQQPVHMGTQAASDPDGEVLAGGPAFQGVGTQRGPGSDSGSRRSQNRLSRKAKSKKSSSASEATCPSYASTDHATSSSSIVPSGSSGSDYSPKAAVAAASGGSGAAQDPRGAAALLADALVDPAEALAAVPAGASPAAPQLHQVAASMFASPFAQFTGAPSAFADSVPSIPSTETSGPLSGNTVSSGKEAKDAGADAADSGTSRAVGWKRPFCTALGLSKVILLSLCPALSCFWMSLGTFSGIGRDFGPKAGLVHEVP